MAQIYILLWYLKEIITLMVAYAAFHEKVQKIFRLIFFCSFSAHVIKTELQLNLEKQQLLPALYDRMKAGRLRRMGNCGEEWLCHLFKLGL